MKQTTIDVLQEAYIDLHKIVEKLYAAHDNAVINNDDEDASILVSEADKLYEETEKLNLIISRWETK